MWVWICKYNWATSAYFLDTLLMVSCSSYRIFSSCRICSSHRFFSRDRISSFLWLLWGLGLTHGFSSEYQELSLVSKQSFQSRQAGAVSGPCSDHWEWEYLTVLRRPSWEYDFSLWYFHLRGNPKMLSFSCWIWHTSRQWRVWFLQRQIYLQYLY